jgi:hypothetical protein
LETAEQLFEHAQGITMRMSQILDADYLEKVERAIWISEFRVCSIRVRKSDSDEATFHVISECLRTVKPEFASTELAYDSSVESGSIQSFGKPAEEIDDDDIVERHPFHVVTFEHLIGGSTFDISIGFIPLEYDLMLQPKGCFECSSEEFCSHQIAEKDWEDFNFGDDIGQIIEMFTSFWAPVLADFSNSFGVEFMYDEVPYILNQVYDSWDEIPGELEATYSDFHIDKNGDIFKDPSLCSKNECTDSVYEGGLCYTHEDLCRVSDCFDYRINGPYCDDHPDD